MPLSRKDLDALGRSSRMVHAGRTVKLGNAEPTAPPIHLASAYTYPTTSELDDVFEDNSRGYVYSRMGNPTVRLLEEAIAATEGMEEGVVYASGMAAIHGILTTLATGGSRILASRDVYGATYAILRSHLAGFGIETTFVDMTDIDEVRRVADDLQPDLVLAEAVSNPLIRVVDVRRIAEISHGVGAIFVLDNTFATPVVINGAQLGADVVVYSSTKHLGGHGDTTGGVVATTSELASRLKEKAKFVGGVASPFDAWLVLRGLRTLELRVRKQCENACLLAEWLATDPRVERVHYPGHGNTLPHGQFNGELRGTMLACELYGATTDDVFRFQDALCLVQPATTLGDVHTLVLHPATTSHRTISEAERATIGISDGLFRISAGIEDVCDIQADIAQALEVMSAG